MANGGSVGAIDLTRGFLRDSLPEMGIWYEIRRRMRQATVPALFACAIVYFGYHTVQGDRGVLSYARLSMQLQRAEIELSQATAQREKLERRVNLLRPESLDPDMLDERARWVLGLGSPDDVVVMEPRTAK